jgi:hypothetical protein
MEDDKKKYQSIKTTKRTTQIKTTKLKIKLKTTTNKNTREKSLMKIFLLIFL